MRYSNPLFVGLQKNEAKQKKKAEVIESLPLRRWAKKTNKLIAPMAGRIVRVAVKQGENVKAGSELLVIEAMKMENVIYSDHDVTIKKILAKDGDSLISGQVVMEFA